MTGDWKILFLPPQLLTELHRKSGSIVETIRLTGQAKRSTRTAHDAADTERSKGAAENKKQLERDLQQVRAENAALKQKLQMAVPAGANTAATAVQS